MKHLILILAAVSAIVPQSAWGEPAASSTAVLYTFEPPEFTGRTPFLDKAPASGPADFRASFTVPNLGYLTVMDMPYLNPSFSGWILMDADFGPDTLRVTLNTPITSISVPFALKLPGYLEFKNASGTILSPPTYYQVGHLTVDSAQPFTEFELRGLTTAGARVEMAIDNLSMTIVPEPSALALCLLGLGMLQVRRPR